MFETTEPSILGQVRPANTTAVSIHSPDKFSILRGMFICNTSGAPAKARIFIDNDVTTYDETTAIFWDVEVATDSVIEVETLDGLSLNNPTANIAVRTDTNSALTFTLWGETGILN